jgi:hypothetical protein
MGSFFSRTDLAAQASRVPARDTETELEVTYQEIITDHPEHTEITVRDETHHSEALNSGVDTEDNFAAAGLDADSRPGNSVTGRNVIIVAQLRGSDDESTGSSAAIEEINSSHSQELDEVEDLPMEAGPEGPEEIEVLPAQSDQEDSDLEEEAMSIEQSPFHSQRDQEGVTASPSPTVQPSQQNVSQYFTPARVPFQSPCCNESCSGNHHVIPQAPPPTPWPGYDNSNVAIFQTELGPAYLLTPSAYWPANPHVINPSSNPVDISQLAVQDRPQTQSVFAEVHRPPSSTEGCSDGCGSRLVGESQRPPANSSDVKSVSRIHTAASSRSSHASPCRPAVSQNTTRKRRSPSSSSESSATEDTLTANLPIRYESPPARRRHSPANYKTRKRKESPSPPKYRQARADTPSPAKKDSKSRSQNSYRDCKSEATSVTKQQRKSKEVSESESDSKITPRNQSSPPSSRRSQRGTRLVGESPEALPQRHRQTTKASATGKNDAKDEDSEVPRKSSSQKGSSQQKSKRADTPLDISRVQSRHSKSSGKHDKHAISFADSTADELNVDSDSEVFLPVSQNRRYLKPPTFNGTENFETFYARFVNCATFNRWSHAEQLAHLRNSLAGEAGQVLWDSGAGITGSLSQLTRLLKDRFGGAAQSDKYRMELRSRIRQPSETLTDLHRDIKKLIALGYPELDPEAREVIAVDRFVDSLADPNLALKIRERMPATLDEALKDALRQEVWMRDASRVRADEPKAKSVRATSEDLLETLNKKLDELQQQVDQVSRRQNRPHPAKITAAPALAAAPPAIAATTTPVPPVDNATEQNAAATVPTTPRRADNFPPGPRRNRWPPRRAPGACYECGSTEHQIATCPNRTHNADEQARRTMPIQTHETARPRSAKVYISGHIKTRPVTALLDTGSDVSLAPYDLIEKSKCRLRRTAPIALKAANGSDVAIAGETTLPFRIAGKIRHTVVLVSKDVSEIILGSTWLEQHDCQWQVGNGVIRFGEAGEWTRLTGRTAATCGRIIVVTPPPAKPPTKHARNLITITPNPTPAAAPASPTTDPPHHIGIEATGSPINRRRQRRRAANTPANPPQWEGLAAAQQQDNILRAIHQGVAARLDYPTNEIMEIESATAHTLWTQWTRLELSNGMLCRRFKDYWNDIIIRQAVIPDSLRTKAIQECHAKYAGGYYGIKQTLDRVQRRFYWPSWRSDTVRYCRQYARSQKEMQRQAVAETAIPCPNPNVAGAMGPLPPADPSAESWSSWGSDTGSEPPSDIENETSLDTADDTVLYEVDTDQTPRKSVIESESDDNIQSEQFDVDPQLCRSPRPQRQRRLPRRYQD